MSSLDNNAPQTNQPEHNQKGSITEIVKLFIIAMIIVLPIRFFIAQPFIVSGASMDNTFHNNDYLIVDQASYHFEDPKRGEVIIFRYPNDPAQFFIKRVIGIPGDHITVENNIVTVTAADGTTSVLNEPYIKSMNNINHTDVTLSDSDYFVMGDNRDRSSDSRFWGTLPRKNIVGRAVLRLFPFNKVSVFPGLYNIDLSNS